MIIGILQFLPAWWNCCLPWGNVDGYFSCFSQISHNGLTAWGWASLALFSLIPIVHTTAHTTLMTISWTPLDPTRVHPELRKLIQPRRSSFPSPQSPALTKANWICLLNTFHMQPSLPGPRHHPSLNQRPLLPEGPQLSLNFPQALPTWALNYSRSDLSKHQHAVHLTPNKSFVSLIKSQVITIHIRRMCDFLDGAHHANWAASPAEVI